MESKKRVYPSPIRWQADLQHERYWLGEKIEKLAEYVKSEEFRGLLPLDQVAMDNQLHVMHTYYAILKDRESRFDLGEQDGK